MPRAGYCNSSWKLCLLSWSVVIRVGGGVRERLKSMHLMDIPHRKDYLDIKGFSYKKILNTFDLEGLIVVHTKKIGNRVKLSLGP